MLPRFWIAPVALLLVSLPPRPLAPSLLGADTEEQTAPVVLPMPEALFKTLEWRGIGPYRGGRSAAVTGIPSLPQTYYFGGAGGGVFKTEDSGRTWKNVSDGFFGGSIGAVAVSESDPNVVYAGGGEVTVRGNVSSGDGMWKSVDAGKTWTSIGLPESRHIPRIRIHPDNPDLVYAAVLGHLSGPNQERGVYRSQDGGQNWERILFANQDAGAVDLVLDPSNPRILFASTWRMRRTPYSLESGGEGSGLWKSTDGGDTWKNISRNKGLPEEGPLGIIGVSVSRTRPERIYAIIEHEKGGVFRSEDGGEKWTKLSSDRKLRQRAWYYTRIQADPNDADVVYVMNVGFHRSQDGGQSFKSLRTPHGDNHDLWIDPHDSLRMIEANDGGANVSTDGGRTWSPQDNQPTAQFYRVTTDNHFPYRIYGAQQDNSTVRILSRSSRGAIGERDWESTAGGESGHIAPHPVDPEIVYGGSYGGDLVRLDHRTGQRRTVDVWPDNPMGMGADVLKYRFQWNYPIFFSPHDPNCLYAAANVLFKTTDEGQSWKVISPDLTRDDKSKQASSGGPITQDNTSVEYYCTIFAALESPRQKGLLWAGSDDGLLHVSRDGGQNWSNVTPGDLPEWTQINSLEAHPFVDGGLYLAATAYKLDDLRPYLFRTLDYGQTWTRIDGGIPESHFTRVIRADPVRRGLLYAGTERGVYVSFDDGARWQPLQLKLPVVPITDLAVKAGDLVAATQGRAFWILDNLDHLRQLEPEQAEQELHFFAPEPAYRMRGGSSFFSRGGGRNAPAGVNLRFFLKSKPQDEVTLEILEAGAGEPELIRKFSTKSKKPEEKLELEEGLNRFRWNMTYPGATKIKGMILWGGGTGGPRAVPGRYTARLKIGEQSIETGFEILKDPSSEAGRAEIQAQFDFLIETRDKLSETHDAILRIRRVREQTKALLKKVGPGEAEDDLKQTAKKLLEELQEVEQALYQTKNKSSQDPLNYPIRLNNRLAALAGQASSSGGYAPTRQTLEVSRAITALIDEQLDRLARLEDLDLRALNVKAAQLGIPHVDPEPHQETDEPEDDDT